MATFFIISGGIMFLIGLILNRREAKQKVGGFGFGFLIFYTIALIIAPIIVD